MSIDWIVWIGMIVGAVLFVVSDVVAALRERNGRRLTSSSWIRYGVRKWPIVAVVGVGLVIWHFVVQAWFPGLPL